MSRYRYGSKNIRPFSAICNNNFGRDVYVTNQKSINAANVIQELGKALAIHTQNAVEIAYLDRYYRGDAPILYREKSVRPEVNNKIAINLGYVAVERKVAEMLAEPILFVLRGTDETKSNQITELNAILDSEDKQDVDVDIFRWRSICGTAYRFIGNDNGNGSLLDESEFSLTCENPLQTFVAYYPNGKPAFSCQIQKDEKNNTQYLVFTNKEWFLTDSKSILTHGINGNGAIPVVEYPNNARRISDIEITISITDAINTLQSDRINGIEQFVSQYIKFVNCEIDMKTYREMRQEGALVVKSNNGENKADVDLMGNELNQTQGQVVFMDLFDRFLDIQGLANREQSASGDTGEAVSLRGGHREQTMRAMINEPIIKKAERQMLKIILNRLRITKGFTIVPSDIEIQINHSRLDNLLVKAEALEILLRSGIHYRRAVKTIDLFNDPELVAMESKDRMEVLYPTEEGSLPSNVSTENIVVSGSNEAITTTTTNAEEV